MRAQIPTLRTQDALHGAAAMHGCTQFLTNDYEFRRIPGLPVLMLREGSMAETSVEDDKDGRAALKR